MRRIAGAAMAAIALATPAAVAQPPSLADRVNTTTATWDDIQRHVRDRLGLDTSFGNGTARRDIIDYSVNKLWEKGIDGAGTTVAYIVTGDDPQLRDTIDQFDREMHLPPVDLTTKRYPAGKTECEYNPKSKWCAAAGEVRLDVESIHAMAPYAKVLFYSVPVSETAGVQGWAEIGQAVRDIVDNHRADVISISMGSGEAVFKADPNNPGADEAATAHSLDPALLDAAKANIPVLMSTGDCGSTQPAPSDAAHGCTPHLDRQTVAFAASSPWVTAVGGTTPAIDRVTGEAKPGDADPVWPNSGAGLSEIYRRPSYQDSVRSITGSAMRSLPDISVDGTNGTSQSAPTLAGILALATQQRGKPLGAINPVLYRVLGPAGRANGIIDVVSGSNGIDQVPGFAAGPGFDVVSGWGTVYAPDFVPALVAAINAQDRDARTPAKDAADELAAIERNIQVTTQGDKVIVTGHGYVPGATPSGTAFVDGVVKCLTDNPKCPPGRPGTPWDTVTATVSPAVPERQITPGAPVPDAFGTVSVTVDTTGLAPGDYTATIHGKNLTQRAQFTVRAPAAAKVDGSGPVVAPTDSPAPSPSPVSDNLAVSPRAYAGTDVIGPALLVGVLLLSLLGIAVTRKRI